MSLARSTAAAAVAALVSAAHAADPVRIDKADLEKLLPGKTLSYTNINGSSTSVAFEAGGRVTYKPGNNKTSIGTWTVEDGGRYCIKITSGTANDHCRTVLKTDTGYTLRSQTGELVPVGGL